MSTSASRQLDDLGRIVIPRELLASAGLKAGDRVDLSVTDGRIVLARVEAVVSPPSARR